MIEFLSAYIKTIVSLILLSAFIEIVMPEGGYRKYIRLFMGLIITITVLEPVSSVFGVNGEKFCGAVERKAEEIWGNGFEFVLPECDETLAISIYKENLEEMIKTDLEKREINSEYVSVLVDGDEKSAEYGALKEIEICINGSEHESVEKTKDFLSGKYGVSKENIELAYK
jgi:stage III sporulation protein AF